MSLPGLEVRLAAPGEVSGFSALLAAHHYLGARGSGRLLRYVAFLDGPGGAGQVLVGGVEVPGPGGVPGLGR